MSTTSAPTQAASRPTTKQRWGLGIAALLSLINVPSAFVPTPDGEVGPPYVVLLVGTLLGVVGLVGVVIAWRTGSRAATRVIAACLVVMVLTVTAGSVRRRAGAVEGRRRAEPRGDARVAGPDVLRRPAPPVGPGLRSGP